MQRLITHIVKSFFWLWIFGNITQASAQNNYRVIDWKADETLHTYLVRQLHLEYAQRDSALKYAMDNNSLATYQANCRKRYLQILGKLPAKTPLHAQVTGTINEKGYHIEKVVYESFPHHHVTADLYIPDGKGPFPAVLFLCGHEPEAKATITYQQTAILFAQHGFVVLSIDPISQGERYQLTDNNGKPLTRGGTTAHTLLDAGANLVGTSVPAFELWDNERGLDYLCSLPEVDTSRLGCLGNSGGGTQTAYFMAFDPRIKVAAPCSYITRRERTLELIGPQDGCQWLPDEGKARLDISDYMIMFAPKPALILASRYDFVDFNGTWDVYQELKKVYAALHQPEKIKLFAIDAGHGIQPPKQEVAVEWFRRWLCHDTTPVKENNLPTLSAKELNAIPTGQVNTSFKNEQDIQDYDVQLANKWKQQRSDLLKDDSRKQYQDIIRKLLMLPATESTKVDTQQMGDVIKDGYHFTKLILRRKGEVPLPCLLAYSNQYDDSSKLIVWLADKGKKVIMDNDSLLDYYAQHHDALLLADLRGMGETADNPYYNDKKYYNEEYRNAMLALFIGQPLPGERVQDIFTLLDYVPSDIHLQHLPIALNASGRAAPVALLAAGLNNRISSLKLYDSIHSYYDLLKNPLMHNQYSYIIPDVLQYIDLPQVMQFIKQPVEIVR